MAIILLPLLPAIVCLAVPRIGGPVVRLGSLGIAAASIYFGMKYIGQPIALFSLDYEIPAKALFMAEAMVALYLLYECRRVQFRQIWVPLLVAFQMSLHSYCEIASVHPMVANTLYIDGLSSVMILIIGVVGSLVCVYAAGYMRDYHAHHLEVPDRRGLFFFLLFVFLSAMFGIVVSNDITWLHFFWEVTTLCCFLLIGYSQTVRARRNAYFALGLNMVGGIALTLSIIYMLEFSPIQSLEISVMLERGAGAAAGLAMLPVILLCLAGLTKSAQMPFSPWLIGAMVAPTPVSALLHSSTMVNAGVFVILRFAPLLESTLPGYMVALVGGVTFLVASLVAATRSNAKIVLAYSTVANLGLIVACAGVGTYEAVWAGILLLIFHAVSKGLLFMAVGAAEHRLGSQDIEDMTGLLVIHPRLAALMVIGILGMFLAPFGMLISKWACLKAFIDSSPLLAILLAYGSGPTIFFWGKWLGKIISVPAAPRKVRDAISGDEMVSLGSLAFLTAAACMFFPLISIVAIRPYLEGLYPGHSATIYPGALIMILMLGLLVAIIAGFLIHPDRTAIVGAYLGGANPGKGSSFIGALGQERQTVMRNYYLAGILSENRLLTAGALGAGALILGAVVGAG